MNYRKNLADNVRALKARDHDLNSNAKIAERCKAGNRKIGATTIAHLLNDEDGINPKLDTIVAVADAFKVVPAWLLLTPDFDPNKKTGGVVPSARALEIARLIDELDPTENQWEVYRSLFVKAVPDKHIEDLHAPSEVQQPTKGRDYERSAKRRR